MKNNPVIQVEDVSFAYNGPLVLDNANLTVYETDFITIVGPNAGGKTTLLRLILGLLLPLKGSIRVFGMPPVKARSRIGYMPQQAALDPQFPVNAMDVVMLGRMGTGSRLGFFKRTDREAAERALKKVELFHVRHRSFSNLSGGQRQRVLMARALVADPELLILDEPTSNVDAGMENELYALLNRLNAQMTIAIVSHDLGLVSSFVKRVACVNRGVVLHEVSEISCDMINTLYGRDMQLVLHGTRISENNGHD